MFSQGKDQKIEKLNGDLSNQKEELESLKLGNYLLKYLIVLYFLIS